MSFGSFILGIAAFGSIFGFGSGRSHTEDKVKSVLAVDADNPSTFEGILKGVVPVDDNTPRAPFSSEGEKRDSYSNKNETVIYLN